MTTTAVTHTKLTEIAERISAHLRRIEAEDRAAALELTRKDGVDRSLSHWSHAGACQTGARVAVWYVSYQGKTNLTRAQALHYLAGLDAGYRGRHYEHFRENPPPADPEAEVRFVALVRYRSAWALYAVTKRTATRVYGHGVAGREAKYMPSFLERGDVKKLQATQADLDAVLAAEKRREEAFQAATMAYHRELDTILDKGE